MTLQKCCIVWLLYGENTSTPFLTTFFSGPCLIFGVFQLAKRAKTNQSIFSSNPGKQLPAVHCQCFPLTLPQDCLLIMMLGSKCRHYLQDMELINVLVSSMSGISTTMSGEFKASYWNVLQGQRTTRLQDKLTLKVSPTSAEPSFNISLSEIWHPIPNLYCSRKHYSSAAA